MKKALLFGCMALLRLTATAQTPPATGLLKVSDNQRYLVRQDGVAGAAQPFFWLGDTAWELFHRLNREETDRYLKRRAEQGFTVIQAVALAESDGLNVPNAYGERPLLNNDPTTPNEAYFAHVDYVIDRAAQYGLYIGLLPTWGDKVFKSTWGVGPELFTPENARAFGRYLGNRYKNRTNIVWILGGDRNPRPGTADMAVWRAMADGIETGVGGPDKALMSFHPQPNDAPAGATTWFGNDAWFDFNMHQNGHCRFTPVYDHIALAYNRSPTNRNPTERGPTRPTMDAEPIYEDHPVCFDAKALGTSNAHDVRQFAYLDLFAGAFGHTYGCHDIWQLYGPNHPGVNGPHIFWPEALDLPGANQMQFVKRLIVARPMLDRIPDQSLIVENNLNPADRIQATRGRDYGFVYTSSGLPFTVNPGRISGRSLTANWFDPRTGKTSSAGMFANQRPQRFTPPDHGYGHDWVLILDDAAKKYPMP